VVVDSDESEDDLVFLAAHDDDPFARYEAMQSLIVRHLVAASSGALSDEARAAGREGIAAALRAILEDASLDDLMLGELLILPTHGYLFERLPVSDPGVVHEEREGLKAWLGAQLGDLLRAHHDRASRCLSAMTRRPRARARSRIRCWSIWLPASLTPPPPAPPRNMTRRTI
jgi:aminopeptidase N